jgi:hypoxanthine phosphoribosyltransferase
MLDDIDEVLLHAEQIRARVSELGAQITADYEDKHLLLVPVLKGAIVFVADLLREIELPVQIEFLSSSSYGEKTESNGAPVLSGLHTDIRDRHVLVVEDIVDTGATLGSVLEQMRLRSPATLKVCTFLDKPSRRVSQVNVDYVGFEVPNRFVVGYGLDYGERYRSLPFVGVLKPDRYSNPK